MSRAAATALCSGISDWTHPSSPIVLVEDKRGGREWRRCGSEGRRRGREVEEEEDDRIDDLAVESRDLDSDPHRPAIF